MSGHIRRRGERSWELKFDLGIDPLSGRRLTRYHSFKGTKREAEADLVRLMDLARRGEYIDPSKDTLSDFLDRWEAWAATQVAAKTLERYKELLRHHVRPHLGATRLQKIKPIHLAELYGKLQKPKPEGAGLAPRTVGHVHRLLHRALGHAVKWDSIGTNPADSAEPPRVERTEIEILAPDQIATVIGALRSKPLYPIVVLALATGMRRGEIVALRWSDVDLDACRVKVERSLEQTNGGLAIKSPKTKAGRRAVSIPPSVVSELRRHWRQQQEERLALGLGKSSPDDLVFARPDASPYPPDSLTADWARAVRIMHLPKVTFHALRHTHVSQLIAKGIDVVTVSRRIGHSKPSITMDVYSHLFGNTDDQAAAVIEAALVDVLTH